MRPEEQLVTQWLGYAAADLDIARSDPEDNPFARGLRAYHCQQAAEKSIKAVIVARGGVAPRTHDLAELVEALGAPAPHELRHVTHLSAYAVES